MVPDPKTVARAPKVVEVPATAGVISASAALRASTLKQWNTVQIAVDETLRAADDLQLEARPWPETLFRNVNVASVGVGGLNYSRHF